MLSATEVEQCHVNGVALNNAVCLINAMSTAFTVFFYHLSDIRIALTTSHVKLSLETVSNIVLLQYCNIVQILYFFFIVQLVLTE